MVREGYTSSLNLSLARDGFDGFLRLDGGGNVIPRIGGWSLGVCLGCLLLGGVGIWLGIA